MLEFSMCYIASVSSKHYGICGHEQAHWSPEERILLVAVIYRERLICLETGFKSGGKGNITAGRFQADIAS